MSDDALSAQESATRAGVPYSTWVLWLQVWLVRGVGGVERAGKQGRARAGLRWRVAPSVVERHLAGTLPSPARGERVRPPGPLRSARPRAEAAAVVDDADRSVVPVSQLVRPAQRFVCEPLHGAVLSAKACVARHTARTQWGGATYPTCAACPIGAEVQQRTASGRTQ